MKVEFASSDGILPGEWMWVRVISCDDAHSLIIGVLDNEPVDVELEVGQELAIGYDKIREHKKPWEFKKM